MATGVTSWSTTAATNATADADVNWAEGMAPSAVNNSARAMMASVAKFRDDISATAATTGSANAYVFTTSQTFASLQNGLRFAFIANHTNTGTATINVDGLGAKPLRLAGSIELAAGSVIANAVYEAIYNTGVGEWVIIQSPSAIPAGVVVPYGGSSAPSGWLLCDGSAVSRTTYAALFAVVSTTYGVGNGTTTFNVPDCTGRTIAGKESSETRITTAVSGFSGGTLGAAGGAQSHTLTTDEIAAHSHSVTDPGHTHANPNQSWNVSSFAGSGSNGLNPNPIAGSVTSATTGISIQNAGGGGAHRNVQPTIILNYIIRAV
jgi:microcystin-dependent protein